MFKAICTILLLSATSINGFHTQEQFEDTHNRYYNHMTHFNPVHNLGEYWMRFNAYATTDAKITAHNSNSNHSWAMGHNKFSDKYQFELGVYKGYLGNSNRTFSGLVHKVDNTSLPDAVDWRASGLVTPIKDQGECGSCWAFSAVGSMEGQHAKATGKLVSLSEQEIVDCDTDCDGCGGGWMDKAFNYTINNKGDDTETSYPYTATDGTCNFNSSNVGATFSNYTDVAPGDCDALLHAVATVGPVSVAVNADGIFGYVSGIYTDTTCDPNSLDHGVVVVGYGQTPEGKKYWIVKNSWGTEWGQDGYIYWGRDIDNMCGICNVASYPNV